MTPSRSSNLSREKHQGNQKKSGLVHQPFPEHQINIFNPPKSNPNGYLTKSNFAESGQNSPPTESEAKLSSQVSPNWSENFLSPWLISSILLVFFTNIIAGIVIFSERLEMTDNGDSTPTKESINQPNLAAAEFIDLNQTSLSNIALPSVKPVGDAKTSSAEVELTPPLAIPPTIMSNSSVNPDYYYILTEYTGEEALALAQQKVKNVSVVNFPQGMFIYMGAFLEKNQAEKFIDHLKQEGIYAYIYPFE